MILDRIFDHKNINVCDQQKTDILPQQFLSLAQAPEGLANIIGNQQKIMLFLINTATLLSNIRTETEEAPAVVIDSNLAS